MTERLSRNYIDDLLSRVDIVQLIEQHVPLKKDGHHFVACCPFHHEKTPSFKVNPKNQFYYCFGCGQSGNVLSFMMTYEHLSFMEAVESLANRVGMPLEIKKYTSNEAPKKGLYHVLDRAMQYYQQELSRQKEAMNYLVKRGLSEKAIATFRVGYAPHQEGKLQKYFHSDEIKDLQTAGILSQRGYLCDRFHHRVVFPIRDVQGRCVGFGGRVLDQSLPKYLNSPETPVFHKSSELYGLYECLQEVKSPSYLIVVEGYLDVIALHDHGIREGVATLGTAIRAEHFKKAFRFVSDVYICFDGDEAGSQAAWRALVAALPILDDSLQLHFIFLPKEEDPDTYVQKYGRESFLELLSKALPFSQFFFSKLSEQSNGTTLEGRARLASLAMPLLHTMQHGVLQKMMIDRLATLVHMDEKQLVRLSLKKKNLSPAQEKSTASAHPFEKGFGPGSAVRLAVLLLLQNPPLGFEENPNDLDLSWVELPGIPILRTLLEQAKSSTEMTTGRLLEHWRDKPEYPFLSQLATTDHGIAESDISEEWKQLFQRFQAQAVRQEITLLMAKAVDKKLSSFEKERLQKLLMNQKN